MRFEEKRASYTPSSPACAVRVPVISGIPGALYPPTTPPAPGVHPRKSAGRGKNPFLFAMLFEKNIEIFSDPNPSVLCVFSICLPPFRAWTGGGTAGAHHDAGLPDIGGFMSGILLAVNPDSGGALTLTAGIADRQTADGPINSWGYVDFKASKSNPRYGVSDTVMPPSVNLPVILYLGIPA